MFVEIVLAIALGILAGCITGLIPGIHVNLIAALVVSMTGVFVGVDVFVLAVFILTLALTHSFLDAIPSLYLGAPDPVHAASVLPGHQLLHEGKGYQAIVFTLIGSFCGLIATLMFFPFGVWYLPLVSYIITPYVGYILLLAVVFLLWYSGNIPKNFLFFVGSGLLGLLIFALPSQEQVLLPLLSGLFGTSTLLFSLLSVTSLPAQRTSIETRVEGQVLEHTVGRATIIGIFAAFLPGFGASQGAIVALSTMRKPEPKDYLLLTGALNTVAFAFSIITFALLGKARNGAIVGVGELLESMSMTQVWFFAFLFLFVGGIATLLGLYFAKSLLVVLQKVNYTKLVKGLLYFLLVLVLVLSSWQGVLILLTATGLGLLAQFYGAQKNMLLGCLLLPVILYFLA